MKKIDARKLSADAQQQLRYQVIRLKKQNRTREEISAITGIHRSTCSQWWSLYKSGGKKSLKVKKRGRPPGSCRTLSQEQETELLRNQAQALKRELDAIAQRLDELEKKE